MSEEIHASLEQGTGKRTEILIEIPTEAYFISGIRDFVLSLTKNMTGFSEQWAYRFQAVVDELCNNAIEHGSAEGQKIRVVMLSEPEALTVSVEDTGTGTDKLSSDQLDKMYHDRLNLTQEAYLGFRGRGLPKIIGEWTDEVIFSPSELGGNKVTVKKYLRHEDEKVSSVEENDPTHLVLT